jgi:hypothetical protein
MYCNRGLVTLFYAGDTQGTTALGCVIPLLVRDSVDKREMTPCTRAKFCYEYTILPACPHYLKSFNANGP